MKLILRISADARLRIGSLSERFKARSGRAMIIA